MGLSSFTCCFPDASPFPYSPDLTVYSNGCSSAVLDGVDIVVSATYPTAIITPASILDCPAPLDITLNNGSLGGPFSNVIWTVIDNDTGVPAACSPGMVSPFVCTGLPLGNYTAHLNVTNTAGCSDGTDIPVTIFDQPDLSITVGPSPTCASVCVTLTANVSPAPAQSITWEVVGPNGLLPSPPPGPVVSCYTFPAENTYTVTATATYSGTCSAIAQQVVEVHPPLIADFTPGSTSGSDTTFCAPFCIDFTNQSSGMGVLSYQWFVNEVPVPTDAHPTLCFSSTSTVTLEVTNDMGCTASRTITVTIDLPELTLTGIPSGACANQPISPGYLLDVIDGEDVVLHEWTFPGGTPSSSNAPSPTVTYGSTSTYTIYLTVTTTNGCTATAYRTITIYPALDAGFGPTPQLRCAGLGVSFEADNQNGTSYHWIFSGPSCGFQVYTDGPTLNVIPPYPCTEAPPGPHCFNVRLVIDNDGCQASDTVANAVCFYGPTATFSVQQTCEEPFDVAFHASFTSDTHSLAWDFDGNGVVDLEGLAGDVQDASHTYNAEGAYRVCLTAYPANWPDTCSYTVCRWVYIDDPGADLTFPSVGCPEECIVFTPANGPFTVAWNVDLGGGMYEHNGLHGILDTEALYPPPSTHPDPFDHYVNNTNWTGNGPYVPFSDNPFPGCVRYDDAGTYTITAITTNINGCTDTAFHEIEITTAPDIAEFAVAWTDVCGPDHVLQATANDPTLSSYSWEYSPAINIQGSCFGTWQPFGNGLPSATLHTSLSCVCIRLTAASGTCSQEETRTICAPPTAQATFTISDATPCRDQEVTFTATGAGATGHAWTITDPAGNTVPGSGTPFIPSPSPFTGNGIHTVCLSVTDAVHGCADTLCQTVEVYTPAPSMQVTLAPLGCNYIIQACDTNAVPGNTYTYTLVFVYPPGPDVVLAWNSTNPCVSTTRTPGVYDLIVTVSGPSPGWSTCTVIATEVDLLGLADVLDTWTITPIDPVNCAPYCVEFEVPNPVTGYGYDWFDGNVNGGIGASYTACYANAGTYTPILQVTFPNTCSYPFPCTDCVTVLPYTVSATTPDPICEGDCATVEFTANSPFDIEEITFSPDTDMTPLVPQPPWEYGLCPSETTTYTIIANYHQCVDTVGVTVTVHPMPVAAFTAPDGCQYEEVQFTDLSTIAGGSITWEWDFGDNDDSGEPHPAHPYQVWGDQTITLIVASTFGCSDTTTRTITIHPAPVNSMVFTPNCFGESTPIASTSTIPQGTIDSTWWEVETAPFPYTGPSITHTFSSSPPFFHPIVLHTQSDQGCIAITDTIIEIWPLPDVGFLTSHDTVCMNGSVTFMSTISIPDPYTLGEWQWSINGMPYGTGPEITVQFTDTGSYHVALVVTSGNECVDSLSVPDRITVYPLPVAGFFPDSSRTPIYAPVIRFTDTSQGAVQWHYDLDDNYISTEQHPQHEYATFGTYDVTQVVTNVHGCTDTAHQQVIVDPDLLIHVPNTFTPNGDGINDVFLPVLDGFAIRDYNLTIWDRWGECIFETDNERTGWDGTLRGMPVQVDVYVWQIELHAQSFTGRKKMRGHVTVVR